MRRFDLRLTTAKPPGTVRQELLRTLAPPLSRWGYEVTSQTDDSVVFTRKYRPWWTIFGRRTFTIVATIETADDPTSSTLNVAGIGPRKVSKAFRSLGA
jgi:hypothetical protein